jgi:pimeloyl-ACP methyl ester carboxylesterase
MISMVLLALVSCGPTAPPADTLNVVSAGSGPTVVLIPGLFGSAFSFRRVIALLTAAGYRAVVIEPLGVGRSSKPAHADYSLTAQGNLLTHVLDTLGAGPVTVVAHSLGAAIAFRAAVQRPDLIRGMVSIEGGPTEEAMTPGFQRALRMAPLIRVLVGRFIRGRIKTMLHESSGDVSWITDAVIHGYTDDATADLGATLKAYQAMARAHEPDSLATQLGCIQFPVELLVGGVAEHEGAVDPAEVDLLSRQLAHFSVISVPGVGHFIQEERPAVILAAVERMLAPSSPKRANEQSQGGNDASRPRR